MKSSNWNTTIPSVIRSIRAAFARDAQGQRVEAARDAGRPDTTGDGRADRMTLTTRQLETLLREAGCSKSLSKTIASDVSRRYRIKEFSE